MVSLCNLWWENVAFCDILCQQASTHYTAHLLSTRKGALVKILTNLPVSKVEGISNTFLPFADFVTSQNKKVEIIGVNFAQSTRKKVAFSTQVRGCLRLITYGMPLPGIASVVESSRGIDDIAVAYEALISQFRKLISKEKPNLILINGTYFVPWCLNIAASEYDIPKILHYHGILTKETETWDKTKRDIFRAMERAFDNKKTMYIFPSLLAKNTVEKEVYGHKVKNFAVLPNPVPLHFFDVTKKGNRKKVGVVSRWAAVKNSKFSKKLAKYNYKKGKVLSINIITNHNIDRRSKEELSKLAKLRRPMDNGKLAKFYEEMGCVISPSHFETYGNVAQEAIAANTPALVSENMGVAETFRALGLDDWIIDFSSVKHVYDKIRSVSDAGVPDIVREKMKAQFSTPVIHNQLLALLNIM